MASSQSGQSNDGGLMSSAGLVRYFDAEDNRAVRFDPASVIGVSVLIGILLITLHAVL